MLIAPTDARNLDFGAKFGFSIFLDALVAAWPPVWEQFLSATMSPAGRVADMKKAIRLESAFLEGAFLGGEHDLKKAMVLSHANLWKQLNHADLGAALSMAGWYRGTTIPWHQGPMNHGAMAPRCRGAMKPWYPSNTAQTVPW
jgi:hypothetical protein